MDLEEKHCGVLTEERNAASKVLLIKVNGQVDAFKEHSEVIKSQPERNPRLRIVRVFNTARCFSPNLFFVYDGFQQVLPYYSFIYVSPS